MIDVNSAIRTLLLSDGTVSALVGSRVYTGGPRPPQGYVIGTGEALAIMRRGMVPTYEADHIGHSMQIVHFAPTEIRLEALHSAVFDALHLQSGGDVRLAQWESGGAVVVDDETGYPLLISYYLITTFN